MHQILIAILAGVMLLGGSSIAAAQSPEDRAVAQTLLDDGQRLMAEKKYEQACKKFEASLDLFPGLGTRGKLAQCYQKVGRTASAWAAFRHVAALAKKQNDQSRYAAAQRFVELLEKELSYVTLTSESSVPGMELLRDGVPIALGALGSPIAIDPGEHRLEARAEGYKSWTHTFVVDTSTKTAIAVPILEKDPEATVPNGTAGLSLAGTSGGMVDGTQPPDTSRKKTVGIVLAGTGGALVGGALILSVVADQKWTGAFDDGECNASTNVCSVNGKNATDSARTLSKASVVVGSVGIVAAAAGAYLWLRGSKDERASRLSIAPIVSADGAGFAIGGRY